MLGSSIQFPTQQAARPVDGGGFLDKSGCGHGVELLAQPSRQRLELLELAAAGAQHLVHLQQRLVGDGGQLGGPFQVLRQLRVAGVAGDLRLGAQRFGTVIDPHHATVELFSATPVRSASSTASWSSSPIVFTSERP